MATIVESNVLHTIVARNCMGAANDNASNPKNSVW